MTAFSEIIRLESSLYNNTSLLGSLIQVFLKASR